MMNKLNQNIKIVIYLGVRVNQTIITAQEHSKTRCSSKEHREYQNIVAVEIFIKDLNSKTTLVKFITLKDK